MMRLSILYFFILLLSCSSKEAEVLLPNLQPDYNILFVGNSLTSVNNVPSIVKEIAAQDGKVIHTENISQNNYSLEDHWLEGIIQNTLRTGDFDFVVAQQGPSALPESQELLLTYSRLIATICVENDAKLALYMVWPSHARSFDHDNVILSYTQAASKTSSLLCPAGLAWKYAWQADPGLPLYGDDLFHPSLAGSVLAGLTIYGGLTGVSNFDFIQIEKTSWDTDIISQDVFTKLKTAASKALE